MLTERRIQEVVIYFEENCREVIEKKGITIIEFKRRLYNMEESINDTWKVLEKIIIEVIETWDAFIEKIFEAVDSVKLVFEQIKEAYHKPTSSRYRIAKVFSKCTSTDIRFYWGITWKIKRWLARRYC